MTRQEMKEFAQKQVEFATRQIAFDKGRIEWTNRQLERTRKEDREFKEWAKTYNNGEYAHLYDGRYQSADTKKLLNERRRWQRDLKHYEAELIHWTEEVEQYTDHEEVKEEETMETKIATITTTENTKEETTMKTTLNLTEGVAKFELDGTTYKYMIDSKRYAKTTPDGKTTRIGKAEYEAAKAEYESAHKPEYVDPNDPENAYPTDEEVEAAQAELDKEPCRVEVNSDLYKPAVFRKDCPGCVDCSKCNVKECVHRDCMRRNPRSEGGLGECPRLDVEPDEVQDPELEQIMDETGLEASDAELERNIRNEQKKPRKARKSKDIAYEGNGVTLTAKQVDFLQELVNTDGWDGFDSPVWTDVLCDEIGGQFEGKPMTVGAMISTLCEKGLAERAKGDFTDPVTNRTRKSTYMAFTGLGQKIAEELGL